MFCDEQDNEQSFARRSLVVQQAAAYGKWNMLDDLHQDFDSTRYETDAYLDWAARTLPEEFRPSPR